MRSFHNIFTNFGFEHIPAVIDNYFKVFYVMFVGMVVHWLPDWMKDHVYQHFVRMHFAGKVAITVGVIFLVYQAISSDLQPFIYFQF